MDELPLHWLWYLAGGLVTLYVSALALVMHTTLGDCQTYRDAIGQEIRLRVRQPSPLHWLAPYLLRKSALMWNGICHVNENVDMTPFLILHEKEHQYQQATIGKWRFLRRWIRSPQFRRDMDVLADDRAIRKCREQFEPFWEAWNIAFDLYERRYHFKPSNTVTDAWFVTRLGGTNA